MKGRKPTDFEVLSYGELILAAAKRDGWVPIVGSPDWEHPSGSRKHESYLPNYLDADTTVDHLSQARGLHHIKRLHDGLPDKFEVNIESRGGGWLVDYRSNALIARSEDICHIYHRKLTRAWLIAVLMAYEWADRKGLK